jgi:endonuclease G
MTPQLPGLNRQGWRYLEAYVRDWVEDRGELYVVTGSLFDGEFKTIGNGVAVPDHFYKVIFDPVELDGIAFIVPHRKVTKNEIPSFIVSIDEVEDQSGLDFLQQLPDEIENDIENDIELMW